ncbi:hypothetical protein P5673_021865 [Acropora cervicornis]|uniref:DUF7630 domain-containing protein n=1 Tax=Acropora cervicornis TaxID=6130 RepID=A0AAD9Q7R2_ACRCE|nr:hypothetical protein P5673_021865 [Acropora cervicornis]
MSLDFVFSRRTDGKSFAGFRACYCQDGYFRRHMFNSCEPCAKYAGLKCQNDSFSLQPEYWWKWENATNKKYFISFREALMKDLPVEHNSIFEYPYPLPQAHKCPRPESCLGGMDSNCSQGYEGPLCDVCQQGYYKQLKTCSKCPSKNWMIGQLCLIAAAIFVITVVVVWRSKKQIKKKKGPSLGDLILSKMKIVIGFYQVTFGVIEAFAFIKWPESLTFIGKCSEVLQLNVLHIAPIHCLFPNLKIDAFGRLYAILSINAAVITFGFTVYGIRKVLITKKSFESQEEKVKKISETKQMVYKGVFFVLYVTFLSTCSKTASVLPFACRTLCYTEKEEQCKRFLSTDFTIDCSSPEFRRSVFVAYFSVIYITLVPTTALVILWKHRKNLKVATQDDNDESTHSLVQLPKQWFWEFVETARKVILTSGIVLLGAESRAYIAMALVLSGFYGMLFAHMKPIEDPSENSLMLSSLAVTYVNLVIGAVSRIPEEEALDTLYPNLEKVLFDVLVIGANVLVIGILFIQYGIYIYRFFQKWRTNPQWSFSCCLALLLPLNDLHQEIRGMTGRNILQQQLQSGNVSMPSVSGALKESGAVSFDLTSIQEHIRETSGSPSQETDTGSKKEGTTVQGASSTGEEQLKNPPKEKRGSLTKEKKAAEMKERSADKVAFGKGEETEKNRLPQDNLQLEMRDMKQKQQTGNVNMPSASGASKKSGAVGYVLVTIHEDPKEASGSPSQERATAGMKQGNNNQLTANTNEEPGNLAPEEELEETHL